MDYSKSGTAKDGKSSPKPKRGALKGAPKVQSPDKTALLARMKAAAKAKADK
jgi:hypothetical protein